MRVIPDMVLLHRHPGPAVTILEVDADELDGTLLDQVKERIKHFGPAVQKEAEKLYAALNAEYEQQRAKLDEVAKTLKPGDVRRGQAVFNSTKTSCIACHTIGYVGGKIGPDLTRIGSIRQERDLLESILFPSASFVRSYEPLTVVTKDQKTFNGFVRGTLRLSNDYEAYGEFGYTSKKSIFQTTPSGSGIGAR